MIYYIKVYSCKKYIYSFLIMKKKKNYFTCPICEKSILKLLVDPNYLLDDLMLQLIRCLMHSYTKVPILQNCCQLHNKPKS